MAVCGPLVGSFVFGDIAVRPHPVDWIIDPDSDDDENAQGFNEPTNFEPGDKEEE